MREPAPFSFARLSVDEKGPWTGAEGELISFQYAIHVLTVGDLFYPFDRSNICTRKRRAGGQLDDGCDCFIRPFERTMPLQLASPEIKARDTDPVVGGVENSLGVGGRR